LSDDTTSTLAARAAPEGAPSVAWCGPARLIMRITFSVDGGLASFPGLRKPVSIDAAALPREREAQLRSLVDAAHFFTATPPGGGPGVGAVRRSYSIEIDDGQRCRTLTLTEPIDDPGMRALVSEIRACARDARGR
jgi:hypothetical protein